MLNAKHPITWYNVVTESKKISLQKIHKWIQIRYIPEGKDSEQILEYLKLLTNA